MLSFFPRDVLDEILNLIGSVSEGFPSYSLSDESDMEYVDAHDHTRAGSSTSWSPILHP